MTATLSVDTDITRSAIQTRQQLGGQGCISNKVLAVTGHLNGKDDPGGPWNSLEYVTLAPARYGKKTMVGEHTQSTDETYLITRGTGTLTTNKQKEAVAEGDLVIAPKGTTHSIANDAPEDPLEFLVVELKTPSPLLCTPQVLKNIWARCSEEETFHRSRESTARMQVAQIELAPYFSSPAWGKLTLLTIPPGGGIQQYRVPDADELIFVGNVREGFATLIVEGGEQFNSRTEVGGWKSPPPLGGGLSAVIPAGMAHSISNRSRTAGDILLLLSLEVRRKVAARIANEQQAYQEAVV